MFRRMVFTLMVLCLFFTGAHAEGKPARRDDGKANLSVAEGLNPDWMNVLLIGTDTREDKVNQGRGDALVVCSVHKKTGEIRLTSLARDMWVKIAGERFYDKINTAFRYGGPEMMMKTVNETLALNITNYMSVNFYGLCDLVDAIGGIEVTLSKAERSYVNSKTQWKYGSVRAAKLPVDEGDKKVKLCGAQALTYARIRKLDNDLGRNRRQRKVIEAMIQKALKMPEDEVVALGESCLEHISTNISFLEFVSLGTAVFRGGLDDIKQLSIPSEGHYRFISPNGKSALEFDLTQVQDEVHAFIYGEDEQVQDDADEAQTSLPAAGGTTLISPKNKSQLKLKRQ